MFKAWGLGFFWCSKDLALARVQDSQQGLGFRVWALGLVKVLRLRGFRACGV